MDALVIQFRERTLPPAEWTHQAHLAVAFWYAFHLHTPEAVMLQLRSDIRAYNEVCGTKNTDHSGYHETLTVFWVETVFSFLRAHPEKSMNELLADFLQSPCSDAHFPYSFYSSELLFSVPARRQWVLPDLQPLTVLTRFCTQ